MVHKWLLMGALLAAVHLGAGSPAAFSATISPAGVRSGPIDPAVAAEFAAFPNGGPGLAEALRALVVNDPDLAQDVIVFAEKSGSAAQLRAAAQAIAHAQVILSRSGSPDAIRIFNWVGFATTAFRTTYVTHQSSIRVAGFLSAGGAKGGTSFGAGVVSPTRP